MIVIDASVVIGHLDAGDAHHGAAEALLAGFAGEPLGASTVTLAEVLVKPAQAGRLEEAKNALELLAIEALALQADAAPSLAALRAATNLKLPDCCVLLAARTAQASALATFDVRLGAAAAGLGLRVVEGPP